jgi:uncharacterized protein YcnI
VRRVTIVGVTSAAAVLLFAVPALAHITVSPDSVPAGSTTELTFHVPDEEASASTVKVDVLIPTTHPIAQLLAKPVPGWTATVKTIKLPKPVTTDDGTFTTAVSEVTWSGGHVEPGQFQDFSISCDSLPDGAGQLVFKAIQTYSNGDIVRWIDVSQPGQPEPAHPAPSVTLTTATAPTGTASAGKVTASSGSDGMARALGLAGLLVGLLAAGLALTVARRDRRQLADLLAQAGPPAGDRTGAASRQESDRELAGTKTAASKGQVPAGQKAPANPKAPAGAKTPARPQSRRRG